MDDGVEEHSRIAEGGYILVWDTTESQSIEKEESLGSILMYLVSSREVENA